MRKKDGAKVPSVDLRDSREKQTEETPTKSTRNDLESLSPYPI